LENRVKNRLHGKIEKRVDAHGKRPDEKRQPVENPREVEAAEGGREDEEADIMFPSVKASPVTDGHRFLQRILHVVQRPERTDPPAEDSARDQGENDQDDGEVKGRCGTQAMG
jgi:hypothetical protein